MELKMNHGLQAKSGARAVMPILTSNLKERLSMRRMSVASEENFEGKLFVQFVALQMVSYIKKQMDANGLFSNYTIHHYLMSWIQLNIISSPVKRTIFRRLLRNSETFTSLWVYLSRHNSWYKMAGL